MENKIKIYRLNDDISFRICQLNDKREITREDCTQFETEKYNWQTYYYCKQEGVHFHCTKHPEIELKYDYDDGEPFLMCNKCKSTIMISSKRELISECLMMLNIEKFKGAKLIRLDDWYTPEIKHKKERISDYWLSCDVKTDKDGDTIIVLYVGKKDSDKKSQFFIKPEKLQLSSDHKDLDPATILSKIEVTLKDRTLMQVYDSDNQGDNK